MPAYELNLELDKSRREDGRTFSAEALEATNAEIELWVAERIAETWVAEGRPPIRLELTLRLVVSG